MPNITDQLPNDVEALKAMIALQQLTLADREAENKRYRHEIKNKDAAISHLEDLLRLARDKRFGASSERHIDQPLLFNEAEDQEAKGPTADDDEEVEVSYKRKKGKPKRRPIPDHIPRENITYDRAEDEKTCGGCGSGRAHSVRFL